MRSRSSRRVLVSLVAALALALGLLAAPPTEAQLPILDPPAEDAPTYVALGDSYAAGPLVPLQEQPWGCLKSTNNYAKWLARNLALELVDATCSGAQTKHMTEPQGVSPQPNPPQFDRLHTGVDLVSLQIGGNDIGFSGIAEACVRAAMEQSNCRSQYANADGSDELRNRIERVAPRIAATVQGIRARSPEARIFVLGYPGIFSMGEQASCPAMGVGEEDAQYLRGIQEALNAMIAEQAQANGASYVDVYGPSAGKTACDLPVLRWVEPLVPANAAAPIHPNLTGMIEMADVLAESVTAPPAPVEEEPTKSNSRPATPPGRSENPPQRP